MTVNHVSKPTKLEAWWALWQAGETDKFYFYDATKWYPVAKIAEVTGIDPDVIRDRRRYLRQLAADSARYGAVIVDGTVVARTSHKSL